MTPQQHAHLPRPVHKEPPAHAPNAALLIDFDNVTMGIRSDLQSELKRLLQSEIIRGKVAVQRAYADWRRYPQYIVPLSESSIDLIFAPAYGSNKKNATDIRLAIDALELVFTRPEIGTFILLSGDSDFSALVLKLKEYGKYVIGVGIRESSSDLLIQNWDEYYSYNELAGLTKESDVTHERHDPWELVIEAVKQMTAHSDVMRSDRLKQVMQEIDPAFNEKDLGFSRFSKFVVEAAHKGLIALTKLDNGQYEIGLGPGVPGAAAQPAGMVAFDRPRERERGEGRGPGRRGRGGRDGRSGPLCRIRTSRSTPPGGSRPPRHGCDGRTCPPVFLRAAPGSVGVRVGHAWRPPTCQRSGSLKWTRTSSLGSSWCRPSLPLRRPRCRSSWAATALPPSAVHAAAGDAGAVAGGPEGPGALGGLAAMSVPTWASGRSGENGESGESGVVGVAGVVADAAAGAAARARRAGRSAGIASVETASSPERSRSRARHGLSPHSLPHLSPLPRHVSLTSMTGAAVSRSGRR